MPRSSSLSSFLLYVLLLFTPSLSSASDHITLGATLSLTGFLSEWGTNAQNGLNLALEEANAEGGINGTPLTIIYEDFGEFDLKRAAIAARKLATQDHAKLIFTLVIEDSEVVAPIAEKYNIPTLSVGCGARKCGHNVGKLHFRSTSSDDHLTDIVFDRVLAKNPKHPCLFVSQVRYYSEYADYLASKWSAHSSTPITRYEFPWGATDFRSTLTQAARKCDWYALQLGIPSQGPFLKQLRELKITSIVSGPPTTDDPGVIAVAGEIKDVIFAKYSDGTPEFVEKYRRKYGKAPTRPAATAYDGMKAVVGVMRKSGTEAAAIVGGLEGYQSTGPIREIIIDASGERAGEQHAAP